MISSRIAAVAAAALIPAATVAMSVALAGTASAAPVVSTQSGCHGELLYSRKGTAGEIGSGIGDHDPVGVRGYCSGRNPYRVQLACNAGESIVQGPKVRSGYSTAYCPKGTRVDGAYVFRST